MISPPLDRLIWKESRTLAGLWLVLLAMFGLLLCLAPLVDAWMHSDLSSQPAATALVLTACLAVAGAAVLFAGEREEGTLDLLRTLPIRPRDLLTAKFGVLLTAGVTFLLASAVLTGGFDLIFSRLFRYDVHFDLVRWQPASHSVFGFLAWGTFFALRRANVMPVVGWTVCAELLTVALIGNVLADGRPEWRLPLYWSVVTLVLLADARLAWQWATGSTAAQESGFFGETRFLTRPITATRDLLARFWLNALIYVASSGSPLVRWLGVVVWRELRSAVPLVGCWLLLLIPAFAYAIAFKDAESRLGLFAWLTATPVVCGLMLAAGERRGTSTSYLADQGVSPAGLWWTRQCFWLALTLFLVGTGGTLIALVISHDAIAWEIRRLITGRQQFFGRDALWDLLWQVVRALSWAASLLVSLFAWGQMCGLWFRSVLVSTLVAFLLALMVVGWHSAVVALDTPTLLTTWPLGILWLAACCRQMPAWLNGDRTRRVLLQRAVWMLAPPLVVFTMVCLTRRLQVPEVLVETTFLASEAGHQARNRAAAEEFLTLPIGTFDDVIETVVAREQAQNLHGQSDTSQRYRNFLDAREAVRQSGRLTTSSANSALSLFAYDHDIAPGLRRQGRLDEELILHRNALRVTRLKHSVALNPGHHTKASLGIRQWVCERLADWANDERQTPEQLERAIPLLEEEFAHAIDVQSLAINWRRELLHSLETGQQPFEPPNPTYDARGGTAAQNLLAILGEPGRQRRLVNYIAAAVPTIVHGDAIYDRDHVMVFDSQDRVHRPIARRIDTTDIPRWERSSFGLVAPWLNRVDEDFSRLNYEIRETRTAEAACLLIVALQAHRLRHGEFPRDIVELLDGPLTRLPRNPQQRDSLFEFRREGYSHPMVVSEHEVVPAGQPLLKAGSRSDFGRYLLVDDEGLPADKLVTSARQRGVSNLTPERAREVAAAYHERFPNRILFLQPSGTTASHGWFFASSHDFEEGEYAPPP